MPPYEVVFVLCLLTPVVVSSLPLDCHDIYKVNNRAASGVYTIYPVDDDTAVKVYCDMDTDGGKWTVFQRRMDGSVSFYRPWDVYKRGFGNADGEYWLGLENLYHMTAWRRYELRVDMEDFSGGRAYALYSWFYIDSEEYGYMLHVDRFQDGGAGDSLYTHNGQRFSTHDREQDNHASLHCAKKYLGGFWYNFCHLTNPNGIYLWGADATHLAIGVEWSSWKGHNYSLKSISMKIRPVAPREDQEENTDE